MHWLLSILGSMPGKKVLTPAVILLLCIGAFSIRLNAGARIIDDAFITYRYARNILAGNGFVYNPGEHVLGTTTPLYTLILSLIALPFGGKEANFPLLSISINAIIDGINCYILYLIGRKLCSDTVGMASSLAWAIAPYSVTFAIGGLETSLYVFCLLVTSYEYLRGNYKTCALFASVAFLTRPDALILILPLFMTIVISYIWSQIKSTQGTSVFSLKVIRDSLKLIGYPVSIFILPVLIWLCFATLYFGSPIPHSITAKALAYRLPGDTALIRLLQHYATPFFENLTFHTPAIALGLFIYPSLALYGMKRAIRINRLAFPVLIFPWLYFLTFALANPLIFRWYLTPPLWVYILSIFIGFESLIQSWIEYLSNNQLVTKIIQPLAFFILLYFVPVSLVAQAWTLHPDHGPNKPAPKMAWIKLELFYKQAADIINHDAAGKSGNFMIAAGDVGVLGYYTGALILDTVGLNSPQTISYYPLSEEYYVINYAIPPQLINDYKPDYVVLLEVYGRKGLLLDDQFKANYQLIAKLDTDIYDSNGMMIFKRTD